ncbi:amidohydrolase [Rhizobium sp. P38BS-XIX]|uniref:amidohydrolase family protein n=1 Tax=Rhizobium sp. P38BS-XIX TaxID=2726740 RepID=UPI00145639D7|nr:amidohydrolase family protein [Rhizobium sp. P38BS-XIX]NLR97356.1 amidohydrolase [Rhizobium sp. P38BS-XIX]
MKPEFFLPLPTGPQKRPDAAIVVDVHGHFGCIAAERLLDGRPQREAELAAMNAGSGDASTRYNAEVVLPTAIARMASLETRLQDLDWMGVDVQVVAPSPHLYAYWADKQLADELVSSINEAGAALAARAHGRLVALGAVALQHPELAAEQLKKALKLGLRGVEISASVGDRELSDPALDPFWAAAEETDTPVFIHPLGTSLGKRLDRFYLFNTLGQPAETTVGLSHVIMGGVLDRFPALKLAAAHGGGYLPTYIGRSDHAWNVRPEARVCQQPPSRYLERIWVDTVVFDSVQLAGLLARQNGPKLMWGSDYPFDMGDYHPAKFAASIPVEHRARVMGGAAIELFAIHPQKSAIEVRPTP